MKGLLSKKSHLMRITFPLCLAAIVLTIVGCSSVVPISVQLTPSSAQTLDQGKSVVITAATNDESGRGVTWTLNGAGSLGAQTPTSVVYQAPPSVTTASTAVVTATSVSAATQNASLSVNLVPPPTVSTTASSLPKGTAGAAFPSTNLAVIGGVAPYAWTVISGALPGGMNLSAAGAISGTPAASGVSNFTVQVQDSASLTATANLSITVNPSSATLQTITVTPNPATVAVGSTVQFTATGHYSDSSTQNLTTQATWTSASPSLATIVSTTGVATGVAAGGPFLITATFTGISGTANLTVTAVAPTLQTISVTPNPATVAVGSTVPFTATGHYSDSSTQNLTTQATWTSASPTLATIVSTTGVATGVAAGGPFVITATFTGVSGTANLTVTAVAPTLQTISVTPNPAAVAVGSTVPFTATGHYSDNSTQNLTTQATWTSASPTLATIVSTTGVATGVAAGGPFVITATFTGISGTANLTVTAVAPTLQTISVTPNPATVAVSSTVPFTATGHYSDNSTQNLTTQATWTSASPSLATIVSTTGVATGVAAGGPFLITATFTGISGTANLTVTAVAPTLQTISVTPNPATVAVGSTVPFTATGHYSDNSTQNLTTQATWTSASPSLATIVSTTGVATGVAAGGSFLITATFTGISGTANLTVTAVAPTLQTISVTPNPATVAVGSTVPFTATGHYSDNSTQNLTTQATWTSASPSLAIIGSTTGVATGVAAGGPFLITATFTGISGTANLTVTPSTGATLRSIIVTPNPASVPAGSTVQLTATGHYSDNSTQNLTGQATWSSSVGASVSSSGLATGSESGVLIVITAALSGVSGSASLTVIPVLQKIVVTPVATSVVVGNASQFSAIAEYSDASSKVVTSLATWTSSSTSLATVNSSGVVTGVAAGGPFQITASFSGFTASGNLTVTATPPVLQSISVLPAAITIEAIISNVPFSAAGHYSDGLTRDVTSQVTWTSSNTAVATILNTPQNGQPIGTATGVAAGGPVTITATSGAIFGTASLTVTAVPPSLVSFTVSSSPASVAVGNKLQLTATGHFSDNSVKDVTNQVGWFSSDPTLATITQPGGAVNGVDVGSLVITTQGPGISGFVTTNLTVTPSSAVTLNSITVTPNPASVVDGTIVNFAASGHYSDGSTKLITDIVTWQSSVPSLATVNFLGMVNAQSQGGPVSITATFLGVTGSSTVTVTPPALLGINLFLSGSSNLMVGGTVSVVVAQSFVDVGAEMDVTSQSVLTSSNPSVATVSPAGLITAVSVGGPVTITATYQGFTGTATVMVPPVDGWMFTGSLGTARFHHTATLLNNGKVLVAGGVKAGGAILTTAELYDPTTGTFSPTAGNMFAARSGATATLLGNGMVLFTGGVDATQKSIATAELFDPSTGKFTQTGTMNTARSRHTATLMPDGTVLVIGGADASGALLVTAEQFDPAQGKFTVTAGFVGGGIAGHTATLQGDGTVFLAGGDTNFGVTAGTFSFDPVHGIIAPNGGMAFAWHDASAVALNGGEILFIGGFTDDADTVIPKPEVFSRGVSFFGIKMTTFRTNQTATLMDNGLVVVSGGHDAQGNVLASAELFDPEFTGFTLTGPMKNAREGHTATLLNNGLVLVIGGSSAGVPLATAELYGSSPTNPDSLISISVAPAASKISLGGAHASQQFVATGTFNTFGGITSQRLASVNWSSSNPAIASVSNDVSNNGTITALSAGGPITITATMSGISATATVTVTSATLQSITVSPTPVNVPQGLTVQLAATGHYSDGSTFDLTSTALWSSSDATSSVTVNSTGLVFANAGFALTGTSATISAAFQGLSGTASITATAAVPASLRLIQTLQTTFTLTPGTTGQLIVGEIFSDGTSISPLGIWTSSNPAVATIDSEGIFTAVAPGGPITFTASVPGLNSIQISVWVVAADWVPSAPMSYQRAFATQTLLSNGKLLVAGGNADNDPPWATAELLDPSAGTSSMTGEMNIARINATATLLNNGMVLFTGGNSYISYFFPNNVLASSELYNPATGNFTLTGNMSTPRWYQTATMLNNGKVLIAGGIATAPTFTQLINTAVPRLNSAEIYDPATGTFTPTGNMTVGRMQHSAVLLNNGKVLIAGGADATAPVELYDPSSSTFTAVGSAPPTGFIAGIALTSTLLNDGTVLFTGVTNTAAIFDPATNQFTATNNLNADRNDEFPGFLGVATTTLLGNGMVLVAGQNAIDSFSTPFVNYRPMNSAELFDPGTGAWTPTGNMNLPRLGHAATLLSNGTVMVSAGMEEAAPGSLVLEIGGPLNSEIYQPATLAPPGLVSITVSPASPSIAAGASQKFVATGHFSNNTTQILSAVAWSSSNTSVATITSDTTNRGAAFGVASGTVTITATVGSVSGTTTLKVN